LKCRNDILVLKKILSEKNIKISPTYGFAINLAEPNFAKKNESIFLECAAIYFLFPSLFHF
jgi:hypothetical protein